MRLALFGRRAGAARTACAVATTTGARALPWGPWLRFTATPIVPIEESAAIAGEAMGFRDSIG